MNRLLEPRLAFSITRTCGGDPKEAKTVHHIYFVLPAHAGVILSEEEKEILESEYYPHMRG